ncbi:Reticulon-4-interacting protein 1, mitochondrial [Daphnia magna]|uniref:Reticulon-4-interacting protein 1, mitochondrial n=1 Tax=Daphnia magna TaxID=35525 RepID=A0A162CZG8_9CRUS|nr:Reticulon-4-interacting protein 1, mitochondrial [Daphnia magna]
MTSHGDICSTEGLMSAWQLRDYGGIESLELVKDLPIPKITSSKDVLVEIKAASVNVLDAWMPDGYGKVAFEQLFRAHLPVTLGRDFAGIVREVGKGVTELKPGDECMGVVPPQSEAASIPYAGLTAWSGLRSMGGLGEVSNGKQVLIMGAAGGIGSLATQLCKLWGSKVVATCATDAVPLIKNLGSDFIVDYKSPDADSTLRSFGGFDLILDCTGKWDGYDYKLLKTCANAKYLTLVPPILNNLNDYGVIGGIFKTIYDLIAANASLILRFKTLRWVLFSPNSSALRKLRDYAQNDQLKPLIDSVFTFDQLKAAYHKMKSGHARGKIVIEMA